MRGFACAAALLLLSGCGGKDKPEETADNGAGTQTAEADRACASAQTYDRLKELLFDEAARIRGGDVADLDRLSEAAVVRMEDPVVRDRDPELNVTTCEGTFVLELPPGSENAFDGERRLTAEVEYAAQTAEDGSGLVYQLNRAEPIIYRLATVGALARAENQPVTIPTPSGPPGAPRQVVAPEPSEAASVPAPAPQRPAQRTAQAAPTRQAQPTARPPAPTVKPAAERPATAAARPSFNCRHARARSEQMVCGSGALAALDRRMSSMFYSALARADAGTRAALRRSRDRFLAFRNRCGDEACVAQAYRDRMDEIEDIAARR